MTAPGRSSTEGSFPKDAGTQFGKAMVLIVVAVLVAVLLLHHGSGASTAASKQASSTTSSTVATTTTTVALIPPAQIKLLVLNGTLKGVLAGDFTTKLKADPGYQTLPPDNTTSAVTSSTVYATSSEYTAEAKALATMLGLPATDVVTNLPTTAPVRTSEQTGPDLILVVGPDLAAKA